MIELNFKQNPRLLDKEDSSFVVFFIQGRTKGGRPPSRFQYFLIFEKFYLHKCKSPPPLCSLAFNKLLKLVIHTHFGYLDSDFQII